VTGLTLTHLLRHTARQMPRRCAVVGPDRTLCHAELSAMADRFADALAARGVGQGDRVGLWAPKSAELVALMQGVLRIGAAYVPIDATSPAARAAAIARDADLATVVAREEDVARLGGLPDVVAMRTLRDARAPRGPRPVIGENDLAYILYTSGSTGDPKGVCLTHRNARAFVDWAAREVAAEPDDRFSSHAPFHFDLSVLDLYVPMAVGASVHLIPEALAYAPPLLVGFLAEHRITVWYSVPSVLMLMLRNGLLETEPGPLRALLFAGEPFPIDALRTLRQWCPQARLLNLYGPTETNVCTFHEVTSIEPDRAEPVPIGRGCCGNEVVALDEHGELAPIGTEGVLVVRGPTVMRGYWGQPPLDGRPYRTGDRVRVLEDGSFQFLGREDHQVKVRGHRIELGEIENVLMKHPAIDRAAVVAHGEGHRRRLVAFVEAPDARGTHMSIVEAKRHCAARLPRYMIVDGLRQLDRLPRTSTGKTDRRQLSSMLQQEAKA
jgi:L-proline---[L-prolyl-carrier protein] ligase